MRLSLMPRKGIFFVLFNQHAENALEAAQALEKLVTDFTRLEDKVRDIHAISVHPMFSPDSNTETYGRVLCGLEPNTMFI